MLLLLRTLKARPPPVGAAAERARSPRRRTAPAAACPACAAAGRRRTPRSASGAVAAAAVAAARLVFEERLADDAARVVLARIEGRPVDLVELGTHLLAHPVLRPVGHVAQRARQPTELRGVAGKAIGADEEDRDQRDDQQLVEGQPEGHPLRIPPARRARPRVGAEGVGVTEKELSWKFAEDFVVEPPTIAIARQHSLELGVEAVSPAVGAQLAVLAAAASVQLDPRDRHRSRRLRSLAADAAPRTRSLTSIDIEIDYQQHARQSFLDAGVPADAGSAHRRTGTRRAAPHERRRIRPGARRRRPGLGARLRRARPPDRAPRRNRASSRTPSGTTRSPTRRAGTTRSATSGPCSRRSANPPP